MNIHESDKYKNRKNFSSRKMNYKLLVNMVYALAHLQGQDKSIQQYIPYLADLRIQQAINTGRRL